MNFLHRRSFLLILLVLSLIQSGFAQNGSVNIAGQRLNAIQTTAPFLTIAPDSRSGALGDAGVATSPDIHSQHWNPAKYVFMDESGGVAMSYVPWLRALINDINLAYLSAYYKFDDKQAISGSLRYFSLGLIHFTTPTGAPAGQHSPNEFAIDAGYSRLLTDHFSSAIAFRFMRSDLTGGQFVNQTTESQAGLAIAGDLAFYYYNQDIKLSDKDGGIAFGLNLTNMGNKVSYTETQEKNFLPINMRLGGALTVELDDYNTMTFIADLNKLMVPTPPEYLTDSSNKPVLDDNGNQLIAFGKDPDVPVPLGMIRSFWDAPGVIREDGSRSVFLEEMHEITYSLGMEYWYREQFAIRAGYFHENQYKGNRKYFTTGIGLKLNVFGLDFSYLIPVKYNNPLANTLRFTLTFAFS